MPAPVRLRHDEVLALIAQTHPQPWYSAPFARSNEVDFTALDRALDDLRMARLIEFTPWEHGKGQGLRLSTAGEAVMGNPRQLARLSRGELPHGVASRVGSFTPLDERTHFGRGEAVRSALLGEITPRVTYALIGLNLIIFIVGQIIAMQRADVGFRFADPRALILTGAVSGDLLLDGQWWRLLTCCFVHIGGFHLFMNMYALWILGPIQERLWGPTRFVCIYLLAGLAGSCVAMALKPFALLAGASGCIWGLMIAQVVWIVMNRSHLPPSLVSEWLRRLAPAFMLNVIISFVPGISAEAHFAGGAGGAVVAILLHWHRHLPGMIRWSSLVGVALVPLLSIGILLWAKDHTLRWHQLKREVELQRMQPPPPDE